MLRPLWQTTQSQLSIPNALVVRLMDSAANSMNCWGFLPDVYPKAHDLVVDFLKENAARPASEYHLPTMVNHLIKSNKGACKVLKTNAQWFGVTYREDREGVMARLKSLHEQGLYPSPLFK